MHHIQIPARRNKRKLKQPKFQSGQKVFVLTGKKQLAQVKSVGRKQAIVAVKTTHTRKLGMRTGNRLFGRTDYTPQVTIKYNVKVPLPNITPIRKGTSTTSRRPARYDPRSRKLKTLFDLREQLKKTADPEKQIKLKQRIEQAKLSLQIR